jgi:hypothetical protein
VVQPWLQTRHCFASAAHVLVSHGLGRDHSKQPLLPSWQSRELPAVQIASPIWH